MLEHFGIDMNEKIKELAEQATSTHTHLSPGGTFEETTRYFNEEKFAELIVKECVKECQREWYDLNNAPDETEARAIAIRVGQKNGVLKSISRIKRHFGIEE